MTSVTRRSGASSDQILAVLHDAEAYPRWVIGTRKIVDVEAGWPAPGSAFIHEVGLGPLRLRDRTRLVADEGDRVVLDARAQPLGRARVELRLTPADAGGTLIEFLEEPISGPARYVPRLLLDPVTRLRNRRSIARLDALAAARPM